MVNVTISFFFVFRYYIQISEMGFGDTLYTILFHYSQFCNYYITWFYSIKFPWIDFVRIAATLASVVLGLPTTLANNGFQPFLITILTCYIVQVNQLIVFLSYT